MGPHHLLSAVESIGSKPRPSELPMQGSTREQAAPKKDHNRSSERQQKRVAMKKGKNRAEQWSHPSCIGQLGTGAHLFPEEDKTDSNVPCTWYTTDHGRPENRH